MKTAFLCLAMLPFVLGISVEFKVFPSTFPRTKVGSESVNVTVSVGVVEESEDTLNISYIQVNTNKSLHINIQADYSNIISLSNASLEITTQEITQAIASGEIINKTFSVNSWLLGYYTLDFFIQTETSNVKIPVEYQIVYTRSSVKWDKVFIVVVTVAITIIVINMGCQLDMDVIKSAIVKPIGPAVGFSCQFLFMPLVSFGISKLLFTNPLYQLGLFVLGCSPGGTTSNFWTLILNGDVNLSITMTFISIIAAMGMMPMWLWSLGPYITQDASNIKIPYLNLVFSLIGLTIPLGIGFLIKLKKRKVADYITKKVMKPLTIFILATVIPFGIYNMKHMLYLMTWQMFVAGSIVVYGGYTFGAVVATIFGLDRKQVIAVSLETAFQNGSICFVLLKLSLPEPERDLAALPAFGQFSVIGPPLWLLLILKTLYSKFCKKKKIQTEEESKENKEQSKSANEKKNNKEMIGMSNEGFI